MRVTFTLVGVMAVLAACKDKGGGTSASDAVAKMTAFKSAMCACTDEACAKRVSDDMAAWGREQPASNPALSAEEQKKANDIGRELGDCLMRVMAAREGSGSAVVVATAVDAGAAPDAAVTVADAGAQVAATTASGLPAECDDYRAMVAKLSTCERMPKQARETLIKGYEEAATRWATLNEASRESLASACAGGTEAVMAAAKTQCGW